MSTVTKPILTNEVFSTKMDALIAKFGRHTMTITATTNDSVPVTNQTIKVYNATTGAIYATLVYNSPTSLTLEIPDGMSYRVVPECTLANHYCEDTASGYMTGNVTITLTYKTLGTLSTFPGLKSCLNQGLGAYIPIGQIVSYTDTYLGQIDWECVNYNPETQTMTLLTQYIIGDKQFDAPEALYCATSGLAAGNYCFTNSSTTYYFTLTSDMTTNAQLVCSTSVFNVYSTKGGTIVSETGSVSTTAIAGATSLGTTGQGVLNHWDRCNNGSNDYGESGIRQWLNSSGLDWWQPKTMFDRRPNYASDRGFMSGIPASVLECIDTSVVKCASQNTYNAPDSTHAKNSMYQLNDKFYLASQMEIFGNSDFVDNSSLFNIYIGTSANDKIKYKMSSHSSAGLWWLRSPYSYAHYERNVYDSGSVNYIVASLSYGVVAACQISASEID